MKILIFLVFLSVFCELGYGENDSSPKQKVFQRKKTKIETDQSPVNKEQKEGRKKNTKSLAGSDTEQSFKAKIKDAQKSPLDKAAPSQKLKAKAKGSQKNLADQVGSGQKLKAKAKGSQKILADQVGSSQKLKAKAKASQKNLADQVGSGQKLKAKAKGSQKILTDQAGSGQKLKSKAKGSQKNLADHAGSGQKLKSKAKGSQKNLADHAGSGQKLKARAKGSQKILTDQAGSGQKLKSKAKGSQKNLADHAGSGQKLKSKAKGSQKNLADQAGSGQKLKARAKASQKNLANQAESSQKLKARAKGSQKNLADQVGSSQKLKARAKGSQKNLADQVGSSQKLKARAKGSQKILADQVGSSQKLKAKAKGSQKILADQVGSSQKLKAKAKGSQKNLTDQAGSSQELKAKSESAQKSAIDKVAPNQKLKAENEIKAKPTGLITKKIKKIFEDFLEILDKESIESSEYAKAVRFLEQSLYSEASFESLKLLASVYEEKKDFKNQINVLNVLSSNYSSNPESFYLLGMAYKNLYLSEPDNKEKNKEKAIANINQALTINPKYILAYEALLSLLKVEHPKTGETIHTKESLSVTIDMLKNLRKNKYYIQLCKAYYDNNFLKQSRKACALSVKKNPRDPISPVILVLSRSNKKETGKGLLSVARKFKKSFFVQYETALHFMDQDPKVAVIYFDSAYGLQPNNIRLNQIMARFLFENKEEEKSYEHFLNACRFTEGKFLRDFRRAQSVLRRRQMVELILKFQKGIKQCFLEAKRKKRDKKKIN